MLRFLAVSVFALFVGHAAAEEFTPSAAIPIGPFRVDGRGFDYRGLETGLKPAQVLEWWATTFPGVEITQQQMKFEGNANGAYVEMAPFINIVDMGYNSFRETPTSRSSAKFVFNGHAGGNQLISYRFETAYDEGARPEYNGVRDSLMAKYGEPTADMNVSGTQVISWAFKDGKAVDCEYCSIPSLSTPYDVSWFQGTFYKIEDFDFIFQATLMRQAEPAGVHARFVSNVYVQAFDTKTTRLGLEADSNAMLEEGARLTAIQADAQAAKPAIAVQF